MLESTRELREFRQIVGKNIHRLRVKRGLTLIQLSEMLNISPHLVDQYELGKNRISLEFIAKMAIVFEQNMFSLLQSTPE